MSLERPRDDSPSAAPSAADADVIPQLGLVAAIGTLGYVFWIVGAMEMVERLAFYGVRALATLYAKDPVSHGGLGITMARYGTILAVWGWIQSMVPALTGGLSDRYGYKETIFASTIVKISGYLTMAVWPSFEGFFAGTALLAAGTGIFKPGIQATLVKSTGPTNSSMAWGVFYQTVNIGGWIGPLVAGYMRKIAWRNVFYVNAAVICLNLLLLLAYKEPGKAERLERNRLVREGKAQRKSLVVESLTELAKPHVWAYLLIFSGFWFMFYALFDILPAHVDDWVDTTGIVRTLFGPGGAHNPVARLLLITNKEGTAIQPEGMLNVNAGMIMVTCFLFAYLSGKMRATTSMTIGTLFACAAFVLIGASAHGFVTLAAIATFSVGEMLSSPKFNEFIGNFAPADKKAMYLGFSQLPLAVGMTLEGKIGPVLYDRFASKDVFSREALAQGGMAAADVARIPQGEAFAKLVEVTGQAKETLTERLYASHSVGLFWNIMACVGVATAVAITLYARTLFSRQRAAPAAAGR